MSHLHLFADLPLSVTPRKKVKVARNSNFSLETLTKHFKDSSTEDFIHAIHTLGSEGKNLLNILNQVTLAKALGGEFVGNDINDFDIKVSDFLIELKGNTTISDRSWSKTVGFGSWNQKKHWTHLVHYLSSSFVDFIEEDKYIVFTSADREKMLEYSDKKGNLNFSSSIYEDGYVPNRRNKEKMLFLQQRIHNLEELKKVFKCK